MRERRFLVSDLSEDADVRIVGEEAHHLIHVLRLRAGDEIVVFDGKGKVSRAVLTRCEGVSATARALETLASRESFLETSIALAIPKGDRMSLAVQKLTELGVSRLYPLVTERSAPRTGGASRKRLSRWQKVAVEACKQSGRSRIPEIEEPLHFLRFLELDLPPTRLLICPGGDRFPAGINPRSCVAAIGPEGGWAEPEIAAAVSTGFRTLGMGPRTLRTETAAIAVAALLQWEWGDGKSKSE